MIKEITLKELEFISENGSTNLGKYLAPKGPQWVGVDNSDGKAFTQLFSNKVDALLFLGAKNLVKVPVTKITKGYVVKESKDVKKLTADKIDRHSFVQEGEPEYEILSDKVELIEVDNVGN